MKFGLLLSISKTHLLSRKKQSITAAMGVMFGIGTYVIMMGFITSTPKEDKGGDKKEG